MVYWETFDVLESLVDGDAKVMMSAIRQYSQYGVLPDFTGNAILTTLWLLIRPKLDADSERYENIREQRRAAINSRWEKERKRAATGDNESIQPYSKDTDEYGSIRNIPTTTTTATTTATTTTSTTANPNPTANPKTDSDNKGYKEIQGTVNRPYTPPPSLGDMDKLLEEIEQRRGSSSKCLIL